MKWGWGGRWDKAGKEGEVIRRFFFLGGGGGGGGEGKLVGGPF